MPVAHGEEVDPGERSDDAWVRRSWLGCCRSVAVVLLTLLGMAPPAKAGEPQLGAKATASAQKSTALKAGCRVSGQAGDGNRFCLVSRHEDQQLRIEVFKETKPGSFAPLQELCVPSWYGNATADWLMTTQSRMVLGKVIFEGDTGTGTLQRLVLIFRPGENRPALLETLSYELGGAGFKRQLNTKFQLRSAEGADVVILGFGLETLAQGEFPAEEVTRWTDSLEWVGQTSSFYDLATEERRERFASFAIQRKIAHVRQLVAEMSSLDVCEQYRDRKGAFASGGILDFFSVEGSR